MTFVIRANEFLAQIKLHSPIRKNGGRGHMSKTHWLHVVKFVPNAQCSHSREKAQTQNAAQFTMNSMQSTEQIEIKESLR